MIDLELAVGGLVLVCVVAIVLICQAWAVAYLKGVKDGRLLERGEARPKLEAKPAPFVARRPLPKGGSSTAPRGPSSAGLP
jgi:hypothetical protein